MKKRILSVSVKGSVALLTACTIGPGGICGPNIPAIYCASKEERDRVFHPKTYGEYWGKPGMTKENWRQDWGACGGMNDGSYVAGARLPGEIDDFAASRRKTKALSACMQSKGYEYRKEGLAKSYK